METKLKIKPITVSDNFNIDGTIFNEFEGKLGVSLNPVPIEDKPKIVIAEDYVEILGHRINEGFKSFEDFVAHINYLSNVGEENRKLLKRMNHLKVDMGNLKAYLVTKLEESKLESTYGGQGQYESIQERIYKDILEKVPKGD